MACLMTATSLIRGHYVRQPLQRSLTPMQSCPHSAAGAYTPPCWLLCGCNPAHWVTTAAAAAADLAACISSVFAACPCVAMCSQQEVAAAMGFARRVHVYGLMPDYAVFAGRNCARLCSVCSEEMCLPMQCLLRGNVRLVICRYVLQL